MDIPARYLLPGNCLFNKLTQFANRFSWVLMSLLTLCQLTARGQTPGQRLDSLFSALVEAHEFNGNVLVAQKGKPVYKHSFGFADAENKIAANDQTAFQLASVSKPFTAVAILQLKQQGRLTLDEPFSTFFPDFPWPQITLRHLLTHTSGLPDYQMFEGPYRENPKRIYTLNDLIPAMKKDKRGLLFKTGEQFRYSNSGFGLLALLVEKLSRMSFQDYLSKNLFKPAGMTHTYVTSPLLPVADGKRARRYEFVSYSPAQLKQIDSVKSDYIDAVVLGAILGPTAIVSTAEDLLKFDQALYTHKLLRPQVLAEAFVPAVLNNGQKATLGWGNTRSYYGLGWMILRDSTYGRVVWHSGGAAGSVTVFLRNITRQQTVVVLDNVTHRGLHPQGVNAFYILNKGPVFRAKQSLANLFVTTLHAQGEATAMTQINQLKADTAHYILDERELNRLAYELKGDGFKTEALAAFKLNITFFPASFNTYDSYADALADVGLNQQAIEMYKKSLELNPANQGGKAALERLIQKGPNK